MRTNPSLVALPHAPLAPPRRRSLRPIALGVGIVAAVATVAWFATPARQTSQQPAPEAVVVAPLMAAPSNGALQRPESAVAAEASLQVVNRKVADELPSYAERHELLRKLAGNPELAARIDARWNAIADLLQSADSDRPCTTTRAALAALSQPPLTDDERAVLRAAKVPEPSAADTDAGESCEGLAQALDALLGRTAQPASSRQRPKRPKTTPPTRDIEPLAPAEVEPAPAPPPPPQPAPKQERRPASVASPLPDDIKSVKF
jgi:hypothetical protein